MNLPILEQIILEQLDKEVTIARDKQMLEMARQLKDSKLFRHMTAGCMASMLEHSQYPEAAMMSVLTYALHIGMAYAKAEREVAELEGIK